MTDHASPMIRRRSAAALAAALAVGAMPLAALAHHGWGGYGQEEFTLAGKVEGATLGNPHGLVRVRADDGGGVWDVVLGPPSNQRRAGLTEAELPAGAAVTAYGHRHNDPARLEMKTERLRVGERMFDIYPGRS